jgi:hypothetical protein
MTVARTWCFVGLMLLLSLLSPAVFAQAGNATLSGRVTDPHGAVVPHTTVEAINGATNVKTATETNGDGLYYFAALPPGGYRIVVSKDGFKQIIEGGVSLHTQDELTLNFGLQIGSVAETVTVHGEGVNFNTTDAAVSTVIDRNFVESLPLNGRSFNTLLQLTPGVVIVPSNNNGGNPGQFSIAGQRADSNNFIVDGVSANFGVSLGANGYMGAAGTGSAQAFSVLGGTSSLVSVDALQEFRIETSTYAPEFGRQPGGQVTLTTRSGTNDFHGGIFDYFRNTVMDANNWFANDAGLPRAAEKHNDFGGVLGGPIWKDKTFFFISYEGARLRQPATTPIQVPSAYARAAAGTNAPQLAPILNAYPQPDDKTITTGVYTSQFTGNYSNQATLDAGSIRVDHTFNERFSVFGRFNDAPSQELQPTLSLSTLQNTVVNTQTLTLGINMLLTSSVSNTLRWNYSKQSANTVYSLDAFGGAVPVNPALLLGSLSSSDNQTYFYTDDTTNLGIGPVAKNKASQINFVDDLSVIRGTHEFKFGADYRAIYTTAAPPLGQVDYGANTVQSFLSSGQADLVALTSVEAKFRTQSLSLYAQDSWRARPNLTLTYGLRWELSPAPSPQGGTVFAAWTNVNNPPAIALAPPGTPLWSTTYGNFAPRIGLAYKLTPKGDLVFRAGWGIFYDLGVGTSANVATTFPNSAFLSTPSVTLPVANVSRYLPPISLKPPYSGSLIYAFSPNLTLPRSYQWNVALEKSFSGRQVVSATYVGQAGRDLLRQEGLTSPNSSFVPGNFFFVTQNDASSNYNALQLQYRNQLDSRLQLLVNYTWSHSLDDQSDDTDVAISDTVLSNRNDWASSSFDVRQSFSAALTYNVPSLDQSGPLRLLTKDWSLDTVVVARTGFPFNASVVTAGRIGATYPRPDVVPGQPFWISEPSIPGGKILNSAAFSIPSTVRQGDEGRNDIPGFGLTQIDFSIGRRFPLTERLNLQFRADAFNLFNHPDFANPFAYVGIGPYFLQSQSTLNNGLGGLNSLFQQGGPRSLQLSLRLSF